MIEDADNDIGWETWRAHVALWWLNPRLSATDAAGATVFSRNLGRSLGRQSLAGLRATKVLEAAIKRRAR